jgi:cytoskeleton protein RodZ
MAIGQKLEEARNRKGISIREASESTKIRGDYLSAFESGQFPTTLPEVYLRGFIRLYSRFLGLDQDAMLADLDIELGNSSSKSQKKSLGSLTSPETPENADYPRGPSSLVKPSAEVRIGNFSYFSKPVLIVVLAVVVVAIVSIVAFLSKNPDKDSPQGSPTGSTVAETNPSVRPAVVSLTKGVHSLRLFAVGPIERLIVIDEGEEAGQRDYDYKALAKGWQEELQFKGTFRFYCSSLENLKFSVDGGADKKIEGAGTGSYKWNPSP